MTELEDLRNFIEKGRYGDALSLVREMEEMSREDKINKIYSFMVVLLVPLIKEEAEGRTTRSWERSIYNALQGIRITNKRRKSGGCYLKADELETVCEEAWPHALREASYEAFEGRYDVGELAGKVDPPPIRKRALGLVLDRTGQGESQGTPSL